eukprot:Pgem_evm1s19204
MGLINVGYLNPIKHPHIAVKGVLFITSIVAFALLMTVEQYSYKDWITNTKRTSKTNAQGKEIYVASDTTNKYHTGSEFLVFTNLCLD